jgi:ribosome-binding protein aMBF1 (putative translation factor)
MITPMPKPKIRRRPPRDDLEDYIAERTDRNPDFSRLMAAAAERKRLLRELAAARRDAGLTQTDVAARMKTSTSAVARLEQGEMNPTVATLQRFATAVGKKIDWRLVRRA